MFEAIQALIPVILAIAAGYAFRRFGQVSEQSWQQISQVTYYLFVPALEIKVLANQSFEGMPWGELITAVATLLFLLTVGLIVWQRWVRPVSAPTFTSLFQGGIRFNTFIALVLAAQLYGDAGIAAVALIAAVMILIINLLCVSVFSIYVGSRAISLKGVSYDLLTNPLIIGCVLGLLLNFTGIGINGSAESFIHLMGNAALPVGLMAVGAALQMRQLRGNWEVICTASLIQLLLKPLLAVAAVSLWGLDGLLAAALILCFCVPTAPSAYVLSLKKGGDTQTMAAIITTQTCLSAFSIPLLFAFI